MPIAKCIGCIKTTNVVNGNLVTPDANVSNTTENAPHCNPKIEAKIAAIIILFLE